MERLQNRIRLFILTTNGTSEWVIGFGRPLGATLESINLYMAFTVLDLFCGTGGISEGFALAGYEIRGGIDFNSDATNTFKCNFPKANVYCADINEFDDDKIKSEYSGIDVIVGGPPCQGFSSANRWQKELEDPRNKLFFQYIRFVEVLKPKVILIENVRGILTKDNGYAKERITSLLSEMGYNVNHAVLNAADYGVPQNRRRAIIIGIRRDFVDLTFDFDKIQKKSKVTVFDAIGDLYDFETEQTGGTRLKSPTNDFLQYITAGVSILTEHEIHYPALIVQKRISYVPQGGNWQNVPTDLWPNNRSNRHSSAYKRLKETDQSCTIDTGNAHSNYFHPIYNRIPTIRESARLQSFPDSFIFTGARGSKYKQIGNAVPPLLAKAIADAINIYLDYENN